MKKSEASNRIQIFLENRGYCGNCDDGEALVEFLVKELKMLPPFSDRMWQETANTYLEPQPYRWEPEDD